MPPVERATAADALVELPEPVAEPEAVAPERVVEGRVIEEREAVVAEPAVDDPVVVEIPEPELVLEEDVVEEPEPAVEKAEPEAAVEEVEPEIVELAGVEVELEPSLVADPIDVEETEAELAELVADAAPVAPPTVEKPVERPVEPILGSAPDPVGAFSRPDPSGGPAHELVTEPSPAADRAASDAFRDLVGSTGSIPLGTTVALSISGLRKRYGSVAAVDGVDLAVPAGSFYGIVGPNGAGKTTILSMITGLLRPDEGTVAIYGHDVWRDPEPARRALGVLPDRLRLFDRLTGAQLLAYTGSLRGMDRAVIARRTRDLATAFGLAASLERPVSDYSLGMTKKIAIAAALLHAPRMLVLDEPFESVDPVSSAAVLAVLRRFVASGGTVVLSSHSMALIESACDRLAIIADGRVLAEGATADVLAGVTLEDRFVELAGGRSAVEGMEWLHSYTEL